MVSVNERDPPGVDSDVNNLKIQNVPEGGSPTIELRVQTTPRNGIELPPVHVCIQHAINKEMEYFYNPKSKYGIRRLDKFLREGWRIASSKKWWTL